MRCSLGYVWALVSTLGVLGAGMGRAQPVSCASRTGQNATLLLPAEAFQGLDIRPGDFLLAYTPEGRCAGKVRWEGHNAVLTLWADDPMTPDKEGFAIGDRLRLVRWRPGERPLSLHLILATERAYWISVDRYVPDGIYRVRHVVPDS
ncbi:hypothetical protein [Rhodothermus profundi]|uniref:Uncharacterized protein n=1 Tax=Rhodothermus profundi TaxID=633813 RepID=A0A1M6TG82_9BACT|nr:hypothetical protein [Rhodothermus profundi]SHK55933.1 hypothetical protein SAMN04488087_1382 [Rhodothermus profundi]